MEIAGKNLKQEILFIADIGANHDGDLNRAKDLISQAKEAGAHVAKFQHFNADTIVSRQQFDQDNEKYESHQSKWSKSVYDVYKSAAVNLEWTEEIKECCYKNEIEFMTTPYDEVLTDFIDDCVSAFKVGSGDITFHSLLCHIAKKQKPLLLATGASTLEEVTNAVELVLKETKKLVLMQCNTNYTGNINNFNFINLNVLDTYRNLYPDLPLGLSDHTPGHVTVLGAIAKGASVIEKHFTDDVNRSGPDHKFAMDPKTWKRMVSDSHLLWNALGDGVKKVEENENGTVVVQRRSIKSTKDLPSGHILQKNDLVALRPCSDMGLPPFEIENIIGKELSKPIKIGLEIKKTDLK